MNEQYSMREFKPLSLMDKKIRIESKINEVENQRNPVTLRITEICAELSILNNQTKNWLPDEEFQAIKKQQAILLREKISVEKQSNIFKTELRKLHLEKDNISNELKKVPDDAAKLAMLEIRDKYMAFASDTTRVSSMRAMASKFIEEIQSILKYMR